MESRLIIVDGYNLILRSPRLRPGDGRTLRESRDKLVSLLAWMMGGNDARFLVVFDGEWLPKFDDAGPRMKMGAMKVRLIGKAHVPVADVANDGVHDIENSWR